APLKAALFRGVALRMRFDLTDGLRVIARGRLTVYEPRGEYQLQIEEIQPKGVGPLELAFRQLKEKLSAKGYFDPRRKKPLPRIPVVTGIGHEDDLTIADMVADQRYLTPSDAATRSVPHRGEVLKWLEGLEDKLRDRVTKRLDTARAKLDDLASRRCFRLPL